MDTTYNVRIWKLKNTSAVNSRPTPFGGKSPEWHGASRSGTALKRRAFGPSCSPPPGRERHSTPRPAGRCQGCGLTLR